MGQQPGQSQYAVNRPITFNADRFSGAMNKFQEESKLMAQRPLLSASNGGRGTGYYGAANGRPELGFADFMNYYMAGADGPVAPVTPPVPSAFQQFRADRAAGTGPVRRTVQYTPPSGPRMARDNRVAGDMQA